MRRRARRARRRRCARPSRATGAGCSSTPVTGCARCSHRHVPRSHAAVAAQRALELPVRMGLATGEAELRGDDYFGAVLNRAARVMACRSRRSDPPRRCRPPGLLRRSRPGLTSAPSGCATSPGSGGPVSGAGRRVCAVTSRHCIRSIRDPWQSQTPKSHVCFVGREAGHV